MSAGLALGLIASLAWGLVDITGALASRRMGSLRVLAGSQVVSLIALIGIVLVERSRLGDDAVAGVLAGLPLGVGAALAYLCYFTALRIGPLSVVSPVIVAYGGTTVLLAVLLRGETLLPAQVLGAVLATAGVVLAAIVFDGGSMRGARLVGPGGRRGHRDDAAVRDADGGAGGADPGSRLAAGRAGIEAGQRGLGPDPPHRGRAASVEAIGGADGALGGGRPGVGGPRDRRRRVRHR